MRVAYLASAALPLTLSLVLSACGGGSGSNGVASTPPPTTGFNTAEYQRSNAAVQAQALAAYQAGATGAGVIAAVVDSGVNPNDPEFAGRIHPLSGDLAGTRGVSDEAGHGSAVSSVILAAKNDAGMHGIAFDATLLSLRTDTAGTCATKDPAKPDSGCSYNDNAIAAGINRAVDAGARVINISLGGSPPNQTLRNAIGNATSAGIIIVFSAGNDGEKDPPLATNPDPLAQIAIDPVAHGLVLIAGATDNTQTLAPFSNKAGNGAAYYLTALGVRVRANDNTQTPYLWSGTSFSAPAVAGAVALLAQAFPKLTAAQIVDLLLRTTNDLGAAGVDAVYGHGELNLARAFAPQGAAMLNTRVPVALSMTGNATLSGAMGDAGTAPVKAAFVDSYGRDYVADIAPTIGHGARGRPLAALTGTTVRSAGYGIGGTSVAMSIADRGSAAAAPLLLSGSDARSARVLAGQIVTRLSPRLAATVGIGQGASPLATRPDTPAFLVADTADATRTLGQRPSAAFAIRRRVGRGVGISVAIESGEMQRWATSTLGPRGDGWRGNGYAQTQVGGDLVRGPLTAHVTLARMVERDSVLGASFGPALGGGGAISWFGDVETQLALGSRWALDGSYRRGSSQVAGGVVRARSTIGTQSWSLGATGRDLLRAGDRLGFRVSSPLRVVSGGLTLTAFDATPTLLSLSPQGHERDVEGVYDRAVGPGTLSTNLFWRRQPGNFAAAPDDVGAVMRYRFGF